MISPFTIQCRLLNVFTYIFIGSSENYQYWKEGFASTAGGLRYWNGATFASFKKYALHFLNSGEAGTEPKKAPYPITGKRGSVRM